HLRELSFARRFIQWRGLKSLGINEISADVDLLGGAFPFELCRQARAGPIGESVGFEITQVRDGLVRIDSAQSAQGEIPPFAILLDPIKRRGPLLFVDCRPA